MTSSSTPVAVVDADEWRQARLAHLAEEKAFTRQRDALSEKRRNLPWLKITQDYEFDGPQGAVSLEDLFDGRSQLLIYHFMYGPGWAEGCPSCSFWADNYDGVGVHMAARDTTLATVARAPLGELESYKQRMGWSFPWYSSEKSSLNFDMGVSFTPESLADGSARYNHGTQTAFGDEAPGISVFTRTDDGSIYLSYQTFSRGLDMLNGTYHMLDLTPKGRDEGDLDFTMAWLRRNDAY